MRPVLRVHVLPHHVLLIPLLTSRAILDIARALVNTHMTGNKQNKPYKLYVYSAVACGSAAAMLSSSLLRDTYRHFFHQDELVLESRSPSLSCRLYGTAAERAHVLLLLCRSLRYTAKKVLPHCDTARGIRGLKTCSCVQTESQCHS